MSTFKIIPKNDLFNKMENFQHLHIFDGKQLAFNNLVKSDLYFRPLKEAWEH